MVDYWIVRCAAASTLRLTRELSEMGFDAWTPVVEREYRKARSRRYVRVQEPLLFSFIFVKAGDNPKQCADRLDDMRFQYGTRVMRQNGNYAGTSDESLNALRAAVKDAETFGIDNMIKTDNFVLGQKGTINALAFMGVECKIVGRSKHNLIVQLADSTVPVTIKPMLFAPVA